LAATLNEVRNSNRQYDAARRAQKSTNANVRKSLSRPFCKRGIERDPKIHAMHEPRTTSQVGGQYRRQPAFD
jgi:hypothetical protein